MGIRDREKRGTEAVEKPLIHSYTLEQIYEYSSTVDVEEIRFIMDAFQMNYELFEEGLKNPRTTYARYLLKKNGGEIFSADEQDVYKRQAVHGVAQAALHGGLNLGGHREVHVCHPHGMDVRAAVVVPFQAVGAGAVNDLSLIHI